MKASHVLRGIGRGALAATAATFLPSPGEDLRIAKVEIDGAEELRVVARYRMPGRHADHLAGLTRTLFYSALFAGGAAALGYLLPGADPADLAVKAGALGAGLVFSGNLASGVLLGLDVEAGRPGAAEALVALEEDANAVA